MATEHADIREYLVVHQTLRVILSRFVNATERIDPAVLATVLPSRWELFARSLHHHHEAEDTLFFPAIARARPDMKTLIEELELQHQQLVVRLDAVDAAVSGLAANPATRHARPRTTRSRRCVTSSSPSRRRRRAAASSGGRVRRR